MKKNTLQLLKIIIISIVFSFTVGYVFAWSPPTVAPPGNNTEAPINISAILQAKGIGGIIEQVLLNISGIFSAQNIITSSVTIGPLGGTGEKTICINPSGTIIFCGI